MHVKCQYLIIPKIKESKNFNIRSQFKKFTRILLFNVYLNKAHIKPLRKFIIYSNEEVIITGKSKLYN